MLPQILGTAAGVVTGNPYIGATVAGVGETAKSGNLLSGIMAGLGAFGGANLAQGVANAGANVGQAAGSASAGTAGGTGVVATENAAQALASTPSITSSIIPSTGSLGFKAPETFAQALPTEAPGIGSIVPSSTSTAGIGGGATAAPDLYTMSNKARITLENLKAGLTGGIDSLKTGLGEAGKPLTSGQMFSRAALPIAQTAMMAGAQEPVGPEDNSKLWGKYTPISEFRKRYRGYAQGGVLEQNPMMQDTSRENLNLDMRSHPFLKEPTFSEPNQVEGGYAKGGYLDGPGDGMSDSIPGND